MSSNGANNHVDGTATSTAQTLGELKHLSSHRLTSSLSIHAFSVTSGRDLSRSLRATQHLTLQFPPDLDPVSGPHNLSEQYRCLSFTPCHVRYAEDGTVENVSLVARNGRVTGLLGLPRPQGALTATVVEVAGGFPADALSHMDRAACFAGGTGIAPFLAMAAASKHDSNMVGKKPSLACSIRGDDFGVIEYFLKGGMLDFSDWSSVRIFATPGEDPGGNPGGKPAAWWQARFQELVQGHNGQVIFECRRLEKSDLEMIAKESNGTILFCGSKTLEWQVKMWLLGTATIYCTDR